MKDGKRELWLPKEKTKEIERGIWNENYLKKLHDTLKQHRRKRAHEKRKLPKIVYQTSIESTTSSVAPQIENDEADQIYQNYLCVQKTIKGRAIQSMLQKGMKKFQSVIDEAKQTHSIAAIRKLFPKEFSQNIENQTEVFNEYKRIENILKHDTKLQEELKKVESKDAGNLLGFIEKELHRLQGEKRAHAMLLLSERERYRREAMQLGRIEYEEQFKNDAITLYLENILLEGVNRATDDENSREYVRKIAQKIDNKVNKMVKFDETIEEYSNESNTEDDINYAASENSIPNENVVMELLKDNIVPQLLDKIKNERLVAQQQKYLMQAHYDLYKEEFERAKSEAELKMCAEIVDEAIANAMNYVEAKKRSMLRQDSVEAEILASEIVKEILDEIINGNFEISSSTDDDYFDEVRETSSGTESTAEILAKQVVQSVLDEIIEQGLSSTSSELTEISDSN
jgi:hypothetical protein